MAELDHFIIFSFILYCSTSIVEFISPLKFITLSNIEMLKPFSLASILLTVGSSYLWSPAITNFLLILIGIQQAGSIL